jgi:catechol 2,3-dioxygenase-like lactoylglutathione lyase family enzyme
MAFKIRRPGHIVLRCADVQRSRAFYGDVVGLTEMGNGDRQMYFLTADFDANHHMVLVRPAKLGGPTPDAGRQVGLASVTMEIRSDDDLEALHRRLTAHGTEIERFEEEGGSKRFSVFDPDGNRLEFFCRADAEAHATGGDTQPAAVQ